MSNLREVFTIREREEVLVVSKVLVRSHEGDDFKTCACLDENTGGRIAQESLQEEGKERGCRGSIPGCFLQAVRFCVVLVPAMHCYNP